MTRPVEELPFRPIRLPEEEFRLFEIGRHLSEKWRILLATSLSGIVLAVLAIVLLPQKYTASTTFVPEHSPQQRLPGVLGGLADQFGIALTSSPEESPRFYAELIRSHSLGERLLRTRFPNPRPGTSGTDSQPLLAFLCSRGCGRPDSVERGLKRLQSLLSVQIDNQTRFVRVDVESRYPTLAANIANVLVDYLNEFNTQTRQSQARERRVFIEGRVADAGNNLKDAEDNLRHFYETNRSWQQSPQLTFEEARLRRYVDMAQELFLSLRREYESARIDEVNDTPVLTIIDRAVIPYRPSFPQRMIALAVGLTMGLLCGVLLVLAGDYWQRARKPT